MPDTQESSTKQQSSSDQDYGQSQVDQAFAGLTQQVPPTQFAQEFLHMQSQAYWRLMEDNLRVAREVSQYQTLFAVRQQIAQEVTAQVIPQLIPQVINYLRSNPQLLQQIARQSS